MNFYWYFLGGVIAWPFIKLLAKAINRAVIEHRQKRFLKMLNVEFPDKERITLVSLETSDKRAMADLERQLREQFDEDENRRRDRRRYGNGGRKNPGHRQNPPR